MPTLATKSGNIAGSLNGGRLNIVVDGVASFGPMLVV
jgi:hypothetical protein